MAMVQLKQASSTPDVIPGNGGGESLHAGLLSLDHARLPSGHGSRSRWSKVHVILATVRLRVTLRPKSSSSPPYLPFSLVDPHNDGDQAVHSSPDNDVRISIPESLNLLADTGDDDATVLSGASDNPNNEASSSSSVTNASDRSLVKRIMSNEDSNKLRDLGSDRFIASVLNSNLESGLGSAGLQEVITCAEPLTSYLIDETKSWNIRLLLLAGSLSMVTGLIDYGLTTGWHDSVAIFVVTLLLILVSSVNKFREAKELEKKMQKEKVQVIRGGRRQEIAACAVVEGDLVVLEIGIRVPGDGLLIHGSDEGLDFDDAPSKPFLRFGSKVVCGSGRMMVTSVGCYAKIGEPTYLQSLILGPMSYMDTISLGISIVVLVGVFIRFLHKEHGKSLPDLKGKPSLEYLMSLFMRILFRPQRFRIVIAIAQILVMLFQQGVPLAISFALTYWNQKVKSQLNHRVHPQNWSACATMGFATVICVDISGESVLQLMEMCKFIVDDKEFTLGEESNDVRLLLQRIGISIDKCRNSRSPIDSLIEPLLQPRMGVNEDEFRANNIRKSNSGKEVLLINRGQDTLHWRGPAERMLERCSHYYDLKLRDGVHMSDKQRKDFSERVAQMVRDGLHPIALAYKKTTDQELSQSNLILFAIIGVNFQKETISTIQAFQIKGVSIKLISEDRLDEVRPILDQYLILDPNFCMLEGGTFSCCEKNVRNKQINEIMVMEKSISLDKIQMIQCLKQIGNVVAFFGGGGQRIGDAPSLREADVGLVSEEDCSSEFTKEASDIIITRGRGLSSIYSFWNCCRSMSNNLQKFTALQFIVCVSGLIINSVSSLVLGDSAMSTIEVIWANLVICVLGGLMIGIKLPNCEMKVASGRLLGSRTNPLTKGMWMNFVIQVLYEVSVVMSILFEGHSTRTKLGISRDVKNTFAFNTFILCQVVNVLNTVQLEKNEVFLVIMKSYTFLASLVAILVMQIGVVQFMGQLVNLPKLNFAQWLECFVLALLPWVCRALFPWVRRHGALFFTSIHALFPWVRRHGALLFTSIHRYSSQLPSIGMIMFMFLVFSWYILF